jgi:hypothetical protein
MVPKKIPKWRARKASKGVGSVLNSPTAKRRNLGVNKRIEEIIPSLEKNN